MVRRTGLFVLALMLTVTFAGCTRPAAEETVTSGLVEAQELEGADGMIHYSYYLPSSDTSDVQYPMIVVMPGYDRMWFGTDSAGANVDWIGFQTWTKREDLIVVSAQLEDWGETSARQAIELTQYFLDHFSVDPARVYAVGYSAGGETMSQAVSMRPDLYAAYLHVASRWDGSYAPLAQERVAVDIFMAQDDEYYGVERALEAREHLQEAYAAQGMEEAQIASLLQLQTPDAAWFHERGIDENYHGGADIVFEEETIIDWLLSHVKE